MKQKVRTFEDCHKEALKYNTRKEFQNKSSTIYCYSLRNKYLNDICGHMINGRFKWTNELIHKEALNYNTRLEFQNNSPNAYSAAIRFKILDKVCSHMKKIWNNWTNEEIHLEATKYNSRNQFAINSPNIYSAAIRFKILDAVCTHMLDRPGLDLKRIIYVYEFIETKTAYIGLTNNFKKRNSVRKYNKNDSVTEYIESSKLKPKIIFLTDYIDALEAQILENIFIKEYKENGWKILNKISGGSLGSGYKKITV